MRGSVRTRPGVGLFYKLIAPGPLVPAGTCRRQPRLPACCCCQPAENYDQMKGQLDGLLLPNNTDWNVVNNAQALGSRYWARAFR